ncbi:SET domain-containing protein [Parathielavia hyrcaniae]|uniref:SET domain-containing protein n=1 Tax=Parathielavia hyrcaniae TaxID=113614 RepID=A0AAN6PU75_9PEZI|nr:SET domain-containing protein [Parathielavia hyrcaniae]KAK4095758.1 SET domain-containing protein [Parathielavia hyrcaniae]
MEARQNLLRWAKSQGILQDGISFVEIPGRGNGIVARRRLKEGQTLLTVPPKAFRSLHSVPENVLTKLAPDVSIHALLAAELALDKSPDLAPWKAVLPTLSDFEVTMPFMWHHELQDLLPQPAKDIVRRQQAKFSRDWQSVSKAFPAMHRDEYLYAWFVINTRTFYYVTAQMEAYPPDDRLALLPVADLFNHAAGGCRVSFTPSGRFSVCTDRAYRAGEEVYISYGEHSNDFLLAEYGFVLEENRWDQISLQDLLLPKLDMTQRAQLESRDCLGSFTLSADNLGCRKTQVALRLLCCTQEEWQWFVDIEEDHGPTCQRKVDVLLMQLLQDLSGGAKKMLEDIGEMSIGRSVQRELLAGRWKQIQTMVTQAIDRLKARTATEE